MWVLENEKSGTDYEPRGGGSFEPLLEGVEAVEGNKVARVRGGEWSRKTVLGRVTSSEVLVSQRPSLVGFQTT